MPLVRFLHSGNVDSPGDSRRNHVAPLIPFVDII